MRRFTRILAVAVVAALTLGGATAIARDQLQLRSQDCDGDQAQARLQDRTQLQDGSCADCDGDQAQAQVKAQAQSREQQRLQDGSCGGYDGDQVQTQEQIQDGSCDEAQQTQTRARSGHGGA